jgi:elongation factor Ts
MAEITATDISKLRKLTGAGMMDCKKALEEAAGNVEKAIEIIRKKGQAIANKRADRDASEGVALTKVTEDGKKGVLIVLNSETDFVAKNSDFLTLAYNILDIALKNLPADLESLKKLPMEGNLTVLDKVVEKLGIIGEKLDLSYYAKIEAEKVMDYIHPGNKLAVLVGFNNAGIDRQIYRDIAMQIAAMNPVSIDKSDVSAKILEQEKDIAREQARKEGKPEEMIEKIAEGKLNKFFKESTLLNQEFIKDNKKTIRDVLKEANKDIAVTEFKRFSLTL